MTKSSLFTILFLFSFGCNNDCPDTYHFKDQTSYEVNPEFTTKNGIAVDPTGQNISPDLIDGLTDEVENCLIEAFGFPPVIPEEVMRDSMCVGETFDLPIHRECLTVKIPDDWLLSCDGSQQLLPNIAPRELCEAKGLTPTPECPCRWRAGIQDNQTIVVTPSLYLYKDPLIRIVTGCNNPWGHPILSHCAKPSTPPL